MAKDDYRIVSESEDFIQWWNQRRRINVFVFEQTYIPELKRRSHWTFEVVFIDGRKDISKNIASKSEGIKLAEKFMRTN
jgi:hypothetical protein